VGLLLDNEADTKAANNYDWTALHGAACNGHEPIVKLLPNNRVDPRAADNDGCMLLLRMDMS
jgi:ankyrin repeat protein